MTGNVRSAVQRGFLRTGTVKCAVHSGLMLAGTAHCTIPVGKTRGLSLGTV